MAGPSESLLDRLLALVMLIGVPVGFAFQIAWMWHAVEVKDIGQGIKALGLMALMTYQSRDYLRRWMAFLAFFVRSCMRQGKAVGP